MIQINVITEIKNSTDKGALFIERASVRFRQRADELIRARIATRPKEPFQLTVDGRNAGGLSDIGRAIKFVRLDYIQDIIKVGLERLGRLEDIAERSYRSYKYVPRWMQERERPITVLYRKAKEGSFRPINSTADIESFGPGDQIFLVPSFAFQMYTNTKVWHGKPTGAGGYMARSSSAIRRSAGLLKRQSVIHVSAVRSLGVYKYMIASGQRVYTKSGREIIPNIKGKGQREPTGAWAIVISYRKGAL